jgi:hypothetical protein
MIRRPQIQALASALIALLVLAGTASGLPQARSAAVATVPQGFVGVNIDGPVFSSEVNFGQQLDTMVSSGVESVRFTINWSSSQPFPSYKALNAAGADPTNYTDIGGVPTDFSATDSVVETAAARGLRLLPVVMYAAGWDASKNSDTQFPRPARNGPYVDFVRALVRRYGPNGTLWKENPGMPKLAVRMWQIWNEPSLPTFWPDRPFERSYVSLLRAAHAGIKSTDPGAKVVLGGLPNYSWQQLRPIYQTPGARNAFDVVAIHPYTTKPTGVITILQLNRAVMNQFGDARKPILATEVGWPSSLGKAPQALGVTEAGQARDIAAVMPLLASYRKSLNLLGFYIFDWMGDEHRGAYSYNYAGLFRFNATSDKVVAKPSYAAFRNAALAMEGCRKKGSTATRCVRSVRSRPRS